MTKPLNKIAVDSVAAEFWREYYKDSGYGEIWVREIPKRVKAELDKKAGKTASKTANATPEIRPLASVILDDSVHLEGLAIYGQGDFREIKAFICDFTHDGQVQSFDVIDVG